jgi:hypothetical protein
MAGLPVPVPYTAATGNFLTSALWNAQVRDPLTFVTDPPRFVGYAATTPTFTTGTTSVSIPLDQEIIDTEGGHSTSTNTSRYTAQVAGLYLVSYSVSFAPNATGNRQVRLVVNGAALNQGGVSVEGPACNGTNSWIGSGAAHVYLNVGDYLELQAWQNSGGNLTTNNTNTGMSATWVAR